MRTRRFPQVGEILFNLLISLVEPRGIEPLTSSLRIGRLSTAKPELECLWREMIRGMSVTCLDKHRSKTNATTSPARKEPRQAARERSLA
jgi:hypothetical protein